MKCNACGNDVWKSKYDKDKDIAVWSCDCGEKTLIECKDGDIIKPFPKEASSYNPYNVILTFSTRVQAYEFANFLESSPSTFQNPYTYRIESCQR